MKIIQIKKSERIQAIEKCTNSQSRAKLFLCESGVQAGGHLWTCQCITGFVSRGKVEIHYHITVKSTLLANVSNDVERPGLWPIRRQIGHTRDDDASSVQVWYVISLFICFYVSCRPFLILFRTQITNFSLFLTDNFTHILHFYEKKHTLLSVNNPNPKTI